MFEQILFYVFATIMVVSGAAVVTVRNPVYSVLLLVLTFFTSSVLWLLLEAEFLAITLILVYVGAVMVLFLFVVMMLDINVARLKEGFARYLPVGLLVAAAMAVEMVLVLGAKNFGAEMYPVPPRSEADFSSTSYLGETLYTQHLFSFEIAAVILLVAIISAIMLTMRKRPETLYQDASRQVRVRAEDRLRVVKMDAEKDD